MDRCKSIHLMTHFGLEISLMSFWQFRLKTLEKFVIMATFTAVHLVING